MTQPNMLHYGSSKPQYPIQPSSSQQWGDFTTEARKIRRNQDRSRLEKHFEHRGSASRSYPAPHSHYRDKGLSQGERVHISQVKSATRAALGPGFCFDDDGCHRSHGHMEEYQSSRGWTDHTDYKANDIPQKYMNMFDQKWHEDDEDNDADQYLADHAREAAWRKHVSIASPVPEYTSHYVPYSTGARARSTTSSMKRADSGYESMTSSCRRPERKEASYHSRRPQTARHPKTSRHVENPYRPEQSTRPCTSYRAKQAQRQHDPVRPRTPIPGLVSTFSWDTDEERGKKRRGGFFAGLFRRH